MSELSHGLWHPYRIPVVVLAGECDSGKTFWGLTADESCLDFECPSKILTWDVEGSSATYVGALNFTRIDLPRMAESLSGVNYTNTDMLMIWKDSIEKLEKGQYNVGLIDTASELEDGLSSYVFSHPEEFGYTSTQFAKASGLFWGVVKAEWKRLLMFAAQKFQTLVITLHMKAEWRGKSPTGKRIPKGKEILPEIASLYMTLTRTMKPGVRSQSEKPSGICVWPAGKSRLLWVNPDTGRPQPLLPPFIPDASPNGIRAYLKNPPNFSKLKPSEVAIPELTLTSDDKLAMRASIAADEAAKAEAELSKTLVEKELRGVVANEVKTDGRATQIKKDLLAVVSLDAAKEIMKSRYSGAKVSDLTPDQLDDLDRHIQVLTKK